MLNFMNNRDYKKAATAFFFIFDFINQYAKAGTFKIKTVRVMVNNPHKNNLHKNTKNKESLSLRVITKKFNNIIIPFIYRPPQGEAKPPNNFLGDLYSHGRSSNKLLDIAGDFNLNVFDNNSNDKIKKVQNTTFEYGPFPVINKPICVTTNSSTALDHTIANYLVYSNVETGILE